MSAGGDTPERHASLCLCTECDDRDRAKWAAIAEGAARARADRARHEDWRYWTGMSQ